MRKLVVAGVLTAAAVTGLPAVAGAEPKTGCPPEITGSLQRTVMEAAQTVYDGLLVNPYADVSELAAILDGVDRNEDGNICLLPRWGEDRNPKSHWYKVGMELIGEPTTLFLAYDNNSNARK